MNPDIMLPFARQRQRELWKEAAMHQLSRLAPDKPRLPERFLLHLGDLLRAWRRRGTQAEKPSTSTTMASKQY